MFVNNSLTTYSDTTQTVPSQPQIPNEIAQMICNYTLCNQNVYTQQEPTGLNALLLVSKQWTLQWNSAVDSAKSSWKIEHNKLREQEKFLNENCSDAKEAVEFAIEHQLSVVNLKLFFDLTDDLLELLFEKCPNLDHLMIRSENITKLPDACSRLKTLDCCGCPSLRMLPAIMPLLTDLNCSHCPSLKKLPADMFLLKTLNCKWCIALESLPSAPCLTTLNCKWSRKLQNVPAEMPSLKILDCRHTSFSMQMSLKSFLIRNRMKEFFS